VIDLHTHTTFSDGTDSPTELINKAMAAGISVIGLTDHDSTSGWQEAINALRPGISLVPGAEISCQTEDGISVHILGLLFDENDTALAKTMAQTRENRHGRMEKIIARINQAGIDITMADVLEQLSDGATLGRPHLADALVKKGVVSSRDEAFQLLLIRWLHIAAELSHLKLLDHLFEQGLMELKLTTEIIHQMKKLNLSN